MKQQNLSKYKWSRPAVFSYRDDNSWVKSPGLRLLNAKDEIQTPGRYYQRIPQKLHNKRESFVGESEKANETSVCEQTFCYITVVLTHFQVIFKS